MTGWADAGTRLWANWMWPMLWQSSLLILFIAGLDRMIRRWAWPQVRLALWSLVLVKLVLPPSLASPVSLTSRLLPTDATPHMELGEVVTSAAPNTVVVPALDLLDGPAQALRGAL